MEIILASESVKRREILQAARIPFRVEIPQGVEEHAFDGLPVRERVQKLAEAKALKVAEKFPEAVIISADTMNEVKLSYPLYKPRDAEEGLLMAMEYSANRLTCYTGICLIHPQFGSVTELSETQIKMQPFTREELRSLVDDRFLIQGGAMGISEEAEGYTLVESISGSYTGAFGLPMEIVRRYLKKWRII